MVKSDAKFVSPMSVAGVVDEFSEGGPAVAARSECPSDVDDDGASDEGEGGDAIRVGEDPERCGASGDGRKMRILADPRMPSQKDVDEHNLSHVPYRNWCPHCVMGRGKDHDHRKGIEDERGLSEFSFDYCFPGDEFGHKLTVLVGRERTSGMCMAAVVPVKGATGSFSTNKALEFIDECGCEHTDIVVKTNYEPAIEYLVKQVKEARVGQRTLVEESPVQSHASNGIVERAVQQIEGLIRTMKSALADRLEGEIRAASPIVTFMLEYASYLVNRLEIGKDGKTAYERAKGKKATVLGIEFGEKVMWKRKSKNRLEKLEPRWEFGIFVGVRRRSGEIWVANVNGIQRAQAVRRLAFEKRWGEDNARWVRHVPWNKHNQDGEADGKIPDELLKDPFERDEIPEPASSSGAVVVRVKRPPPREFYIKKEDAVQHGYSRGCAGCSSWYRGLARQPHSAFCRQRFRRLMEQDARVTNAKARKDEYDERLAKKAKKKLDKEELVLERKRENSADVEDEQDDKRVQMT